MIALDTRLKPSPTLAIALQEILLQVAAPDVARSARRTETKDGHPASIRGLSMLPSFLKSFRTWIWIVAGAHVIFSLAELTLWRLLTPVLKIFVDNGRATAAEQARDTAPLGMNMGLYNGIVAACLFWLLLVPDLGPKHFKSLATLLLSCVILAGLFGGVTIIGTIPIVQSGPAAIALYLLWRSGS